MIDRKFKFLAVNPSNGRIVTEDEGVVFLAKDNLFLPTLIFYLGLVMQAKGNDSDEAEALRLMIDRVSDWRVSHPDQLRLPDISGEEERRRLLAPDVETLHVPV